MSIQGRTTMKNTLVYHLIVTLPIVVFFYYWLENGKSALALVTFCILYAFVFRPLMDYYRLRSLNIVEKDDLLKMWKWLGLYRFRYYTALMFGKREG